MQSQHVDYIYPKNEIVNYTDSVVFKWNNSIDESTYQFQISKDESFSVIITDSIDISGNTLTLILPTSTSKYYWRCKKTEDAWSEINIAKFYQFQPNQINGLKLWYNTDSLEQSSNAISKIFDLSGNDNHIIQNTATNKPTLISASDLNENTIRFDGSSDFMRGNFTDTIKPPYSIFVMWNLTESKTAFCFDGVSSDPTNNLSTSSPYLRYQATSYLFYTQNMPFTFMLTSLKINGANSKIYQNSVLKSTANPGNSYFKGLTLGASRSTGGFLKGDIAEFVLYSVTLSDSEFSLVENYYYSKYTPPVNLGEDIYVEYGFCDTTISASKNWYVSYIWSTGSTAPYIDVSKTGNYSVTVTDIIGRVSIDSINVYFPSVNTISDTTICLNQTILWDTELIGDYDFTWYGSSETTNSILINMQGQYAVMVTDTNECNYLTDTIFVSTDNFSINFNQPDTSICLGNSITIDFASDLITFYSWSSGQETEVIYPTISDIYYVTVTNLRGCTAIDSIDVQIAGVAPSPVFTINGTCINNETLFTDESFPQDSIASWMWTINSSEVFNSQIMSYTFDEPGMQSVNLSISSNSGCTKDTTILFEVYDVPNISFTIPKICMNVPFTIIPNIQLPINQSITDYNWNIGGTNVSFEDTLVYNVYTDGIFNLNLSILSSAGCNVSFDTSFVAQSEFPTPEFFSLVTPSDEALYQNESIDFSWNNDLDVLYYEIEFSTDSNFNDIFYSLATGPANILNINTYWLYDTVYWHVKAYNHCLVNTTSATRMLKYFSPNSGDNLICWYSGDSTITSGSNVAQCFDKSGNNNHLLQTTESNKPSLNFSLLGSPVIDFDGNSDYLRGALVDTLRSPFSIFMIWAVDESKTQYAIDGLLNDPTSNISMSDPYLRFQAASYLYYNRLMPFNFIVTSLISNGSDSEISENGTFKASSNPGSSYYNGITLGASRLSSSFLNGKIGEVLIFDTVINDSISAIIESYLYNKYAPPVNLLYDIRVPYGFCDTAITTAYKPWFTSYEWSTGETDSVIHVNKPGVYSCTVTDIFGFESSDDIRVFYPQVNNFADTIICYGNSVIWDAELTGDYSYEWLGSPETTQSIEIFYEGDYALIITDSLGCKYYSDTINFSFDKYELTASIGPADTLLCAGNRLSLATNSDETVSYLWSTGAETPEITLSESGTYSVTCTNWRACSAKDEIAVTIMGTVPNPDFSVQGHCAKNLISFNDQSTSPEGNINFWQWFVNGEVFASSQNSEITLDEPGNYNIRLQIKTDLDCGDYLDETIEVFPLPEPKFFPDYYCQWAEIDFISKTTILSGNILNNYWQFNDFDLFGDTVSYVFENSGINTVKLISESEQACRDSIIKEIFVKQAVKPDFLSQNACVNSESSFINITEQSSYNLPVSWNWNFGDGNFGENSDPSHVYENSGIYDVSLSVVWQNTCETSITKQIEIYDNPELELLVENSCVNSEFTVAKNIESQSGEIVEYIWNFNGNEIISNTDASPTFVCDTIGEYPISLEIKSEYGCEAFAQDTIKVYPLPQVDFAMSRDWGGFPFTVDFTNLSQGASQYLWSFGDSESSIEENPTHIYISEGEFFVNLTAVSEYGCSDYIEKKIISVNPIMDLILYDLRTKLNGNYLEISVYIINNGTLPVSKPELVLNLGEGKIYRESLDSIPVSQVIDYTLKTEIWRAEKTLPEIICLEVFANPYEGHYENNTEDNLICSANVKNLLVFQPYPNPTNQSLNIEYILAKPAECLITITNSMGKQVYVNKFENQTQYNKLELDVSEFAVGVYYLQVQSGGERESRKVVVY